jgi:hypothetical protein
MNEKQAGTPIFRELEELIERYARDHNLLIKEIRVGWEILPAYGARATGKVTGLYVESTTGDGP